MFQKTLRKLSFAKILIVLFACAVLALGSIFIINSKNISSPSPKPNQVYAASSSTLNKNWKKLVEASVTSSSVSYSSFLSVTFTSDKSAVPSTEGADAKNVVGTANVGCTDDEGTVVDPTSPITAYVIREITSSGYKHSCIVYSAGTIYAPIDSSSLFSYSNNLILKNLNTSKATNMSSMFYDSDFSSIDLSLCTFDTSKVTNMASMFSRCCYLKALDLSACTNFSTKLVTNMSYMFYGTDLTTAGSGSNYKLNFGRQTKFDTSNVTDMSYMFAGNYYNYSSDPVSEFTEIDLSIFKKQSSANNQNFPEAKKLKSLRGMFSECHYLKKVTWGQSFSTGDVTDMSYMFENCNALKSFDASKLNTSSVTTMTEIFSGTGFTTAGATKCDLNFGTKFDVSNVTSFNGMFRGHEYNSGDSYYSTKLQSIDMSAWKCPTTKDTNKSVTFERMFYSCENLISVNFGDNFTIPNATSFDSMFKYCTHISDINFGKSFVPQSVTNFRYMFAYCHDIVGIDLTMFVTSSATNMEYMFFDCNSLTSLDLRAFITSKVTTMSHMFAVAKDNVSSLSNLTLNFNTKSLTNMQAMFQYCSSLTAIELSSFNTNNVTDMSYLFDGCSSLSSAGANNSLNNYAINFGDSFYTNKVTDMRYMFNNCSGMILIDLSRFVTPNLTNLSHAFNGCKSAKNIYFSSNFTTNKVTDMEYLFNDCTSLNDTLDLTYFSAKQISSTQNMFAGCSQLKNLLLGADFTIEKATNMQNMFSKCSNLNNIDISMFNTSQVIDMSYLFFDCSTFTKLNLSNFDTSNVTKMRNMFARCSNIASIGVGDNYDLNLGENFNTSNVTNMISMFEYCGKTTTMELGSKFDVSKVTGVASMFANCSSLKSLGVVKNWNTTKFKDMSNMFAGCSTLTELDLGNFSISSGTGITGLISGCSALEVIKAPTIDSQNQSTDLPTIFKSTSTNKSYQQLSYLTNRQELRRAGIFLYSSFRSTIGSDVCQKIATISFTSNLLTLDKTKTDYSTIELLEAAATGGIYAVGTGNTSGTSYSNTSMLKAYLLPSNTYFDAEGNPLYDCIIYCPNKNLVIFAPVSCNKLFAGKDEYNTYFANLKEVNLDNLDTTYTNDMSEMFLNCEEVRSITMNKLVTKDVLTMEDMLKNCPKLSYIYTCALPAGMDVDLPGSYYNSKSSSDNNTYEKMPSKVMELARIFALKLDVSNVNNFSEKGWEVDPTDTNFVKKNYFYNSTIGNLPQLVVGNRVFFGWGTVDRDGNWTAFTSKKFASLEDIVLYPKWAKVNITFVVDVGQIDPQHVVTTQMVTKQQEDGTEVQKVASKSSLAPADWGTKFDGTTLSLFVGDEYGQLPNAKRDGYTFVGWFTELQGTTAVLSADVIPQAEDANAETYDVTLYSGWEKIINLANVRTITYNANGGTINANYGQKISYKTEQQTDQTTGEEVTKTVAVVDDTQKVEWTMQDKLASKKTDVGEIYDYFPLINYAGYTFIGWFTAQEGGDRVASADMIESDTSKEFTLYAHWEKTPIKSLDKNTLIYVGLGVVAIAVLSIVFAAVKKSHKSKTIVTINEDYINKFNQDNPQNTDATKNPKLDKDLQNAYSPSDDTSNDADDGNQQQNATNGSDGQDQNNSNNFSDLDI